MESRFHRQVFLAALGSISGCSTSQPARPAVQEAPAAQSLPATASRPGPALAQVRELSKEAAELKQSGDHAAARAKIRKAWKTHEQSEESRDVQDLRIDIAEAAYAAGDLRAAQVAWQSVVNQWERTLPDDHSDLLVVRENLAVTKRRLGDVSGAEALQKQVLSVRTRILPDDHPDLQRTRGNLAVTKRELGDLPGACALEEQVLAVFTRTLPDDHPDLQKARLNLGVTKFQLGVLPVARSLFEQVLAVLTRTLPDDHPDLQTARSNLASARRKLGDPSGARTLGERVLGVRTRTLPDDHPDLQMARMNLATAKYQLGDVSGAQVLFEQALAVSTRILPDDHPDLQRARGNMAEIKRQLGDLPGACVLEEQVLAVFTRILPDDHADLQRARMNLSETKRQLGAPSGARALLEQALEVWTRTLPEDHPDLQLARENLAVISADLGNLQQARALQEQVLTASTRILPDDHPAVQHARSNVISFRAKLHDDSCASLVEDLTKAWRSAVHSPALAPQEAGALVEAHVDALNLPLSIVLGCGTLPPRSDLADEVLLCAESLRGAEVLSSRQARRALAGPRAAETDALQKELVQAREAVTRIAASKEENPARTETLAAAVRSRDQVERKLRELSAKVSTVDFRAVTCAELAAKLPVDAAAATILRFHHHRFDRADGTKEDVRHRLVALVLGPNRRVAALELTDVETLEKLVAQVTESITRGALRGESLANPADPLVSLRELRRLVLDPILAATPGCRTLYASLDPSLAVIPLDALPLETGESVGEKVRIRQVTCLLDLMEDPAPVREHEPRFVAMGGLEYDEAPSAVKPLAVLSPSAMLPPEPTRHGAPASFRFLRYAEEEVRDLERYFRKAFPHGQATLRLGREGDKRALLELSRGASFLHLATHGYFAPESIACTLDQPKARENLLRLEQSRRPTGLSPMVLAGLALSGANIAADPLGHKAGIVTAEEMLSLDLTRCELVVLSACKTSLGVWRAGLGYASLRTALRAAGARAVVTSLWEVDDKKTRDLIVEFYRRVWLEKKDPHEALWEAKREMRRKPDSRMADWAGWVLTGG